MRTFNWYVPIKPGDSALKSILPVAFPMETAGAVFVFG
jgi:hypothetical protein